MRLFLAHGDRWLAQVQQDRVVVHERRVESAPSFSNVGPRLLEVVEKTSSALAHSLLEGEHRGEIAEVIYENRIPGGEGWSGFSELDKVLRVVSPSPGTGRFETVENLQLAYSFQFLKDGAFAGRMRVLAEPQREPNGQPVLHLRLISRRIVGTDPLGDVLEECHADIVEGFTAITTDNMHQLWGRTQ